MRSRSLSIIWPSFSYGDSSPSCFSKQSVNTFPVAWLLNSPPRARQLNKFFIMPAIVGPKLELGGIGAESVEESLEIAELFHYMANVSTDGMGGPIDPLSDLSSPPSAPVRTWMSVIVFDIGVKEVAFFCMLLLFLHAYLTIIRRLCPLPLTANEILAIHQYYEQSDHDSSSVGFANSFTGSCNHQSGLTAKQIEDASVSFDIHAPHESSKSCMKENEIGEGGRDCVLEFGTDVCAICLEEVYSTTSPARLRRLQCEHLFHQGKFPSLFICNEDQFFYFWMSFGRFCPC